MPRYNGRVALNVDYWNGFLDALGIELAEEQVFLQSKEGWWSGPDWPLEAASKALARITNVDDIKFDWARDNYGPIRVVSVKVSLQRTDRSAAYDECLDKALAEIVDAGIRRAAFTLIADDSPP